jgi:hypothetical protein
MMMTLSEDFKKDVVIRAKELNHKPGVNSSDWDLVDEKLLVVIDWLISHCDKRGLQLRITSIIRPKIPGFSVSRTHEEKRAFDVGLIGWTDSDARDCVVRAAQDLKGIGAISAKTGREAVAVFEDGITAGKGRHLHFQVRR